MAELFEEVVALLETRSATRALAGNCRVESEQSAGTGAVLGVPIFLAAMSDWAVDPDRSESLSKILRSIETTGLQDPGASIEGQRYDPVGSELANMLLGQRRPAVASLIAEEAGVKRSSANGLLPPTAWVVMASLADRYGSRIDRQSLISILSREHQDLVEGGWGPWLEASGQSGSGPLLADDAKLGFDPDESATLNPNLGNAGAAPVEEHSTGDWFSPSEEAFDPVESYPPPVTRSARLTHDGLAAATAVNQQTGIQQPGVQQPGNQQAVNGLAGNQPASGLVADGPTSVEQTLIDQRPIDPNPSATPAFNRPRPESLRNEASNTGAVGRDGLDAARVSRDFEPSADPSAGPSEVVPRSSYRTYDARDYSAKDYEIEPFDDEALVSNRVPLIIGILALFLLVVAGIYWILDNRQTGDTQTVDDEQTEAEDAQGAESGAGDEDDAAATDDEADAGTATEMVALDIVMNDPLGRSTATGVAELRFDDEVGEVCYNFTVEELRSPFEGHIHVGPEGVKGGIVIDFGMLNNSDIGCATTTPTEVAAILSDLPGHYVELHDPDEAFTIRAQLSEALPEGAGTAGDLADNLFDPNGGGALTRVEPGRLVVVGEVADQATADRLLAEYADAEELGLELVDELTIVAGAPVPSGLITIENSSLFAIGSDQLLPDRGTAIADLATLLQARPEWTATIIGHTDSTGSEVINLELSLRRAEAVRDELIASGVATESLLVTGAGSTKPIADNGTEEGRALNRRIEVSIDRG